MLITYHGHAQFLLESANGFRLLTDPYDPGVGYPCGRVEAEAVCVSHGHGDHNYTDKVTGGPFVFRAPGKYQATPEIRVTGIPSVHDDAGGAKRGENIIFLIEMDGLFVAHLGDQGCYLTQDQLKALGRVDILMVPVGGYYTIDAKTAAGVTAQVNPRVVIPMHYRTAYNPNFPVSDEKPFLDLMREPAALPMPLLRVTKGDLSEQPAVALLSPRPVA